MSSELAVHHVDTSDDSPITFERIYRSELHYVWHTLRRLAVPESDRSDLAHDIFVIVHRRLATYDPRCSLRAWLFGISYRVVLDYKRLARHRREVVMSQPDDLRREHGLDPAAAQENRQLVLAALAGIKLERCAVFIMHDLDGYSIPEIASVMGMSHNTLYSHLRRARKRFAAEVKRLSRPGGKR